MSEGVPVSATDELRERLRVVLAENGVDEAPATLHSWRCEYPERYGKCDCIAELVTDLAAVVAEARTEGAIAELEYLSADTAKTLQVWTPSDLNERAAALRGVGNQKVGVTVDDLALDEMDGNQNAESERHKVCTCWRLNPDGTHQRGCDFFVADQKGTEQ